MIRLAAGLQSLALNYSVMTETPSGNKVAAGARCRCRGRLTVIMRIEPRSALTLAGVVAFCAYSIPSLRGPTETGGLGAPPREKLRGPVLSEVEDRLKRVRTTSSGVPCLEFLRASYAIVTIFDAIPGMGMVKGDMLGNVDKIWRHQQVGAALSLQAMCDSEIDALGGDADVARKRDGSVCNSLLWLKRALRLVEGILLELTRHKLKSMKECCNAAYATSLKKHHNMVLRSAFGVAVNAAPSRTAVLETLNPRVGEAPTLATISKLLPRYTSMLNTVEAYLTERKIER